MGLSARKVGEVRKIALAQGFLDKQREIPSDEMIAKFFKPSTVIPVTQSTVFLYQQQLEDWCRQGIQASTMYAALQRQYGFSGSYNAVQRFVKKIKDKSSSNITTILEFIRIGK